MRDTFKGPYGSFCDELWRDWLADRLSPSAFVGGEFDEQSAPEPWLEFRDGPYPLVAVTTNPGGSLEHQRRDRIVNGVGPIKPTQSYQEATDGLGLYYETNLTKRSAARQRINAFVRLAGSAGYEGLVQVEACPFHSADLPDKPALVRAVEHNTNNLLRQYAAHLQGFLHSHDVVGLSAVSPRISLSVSGVFQAFSESIWLPWFAHLIGLDPGRAEHVELAHKVVVGQSSGKITAAAFVETIGKRRKALVLTMGGNRLPGENGLQVLASAIRRKVGHAG